MPSENISKHFGNRLRCRVNGLLIEKNRILLIKHKGLGKDGYLWAPPGGGLEYGSPAIENLKREYLEETGLLIKVGNFLFNCEYINPPLHAIEMFFEVSRVGGEFYLGKDPELGDKDQIIESVNFLSIEEIKSIPLSALHSILHDINNLEELLLKKGYYSI